ncbi:MAG: hypothetical protein WAK82_34265 [Streptosporangiaceae bacterium]
MGTDGSVVQGRAPVPPDPPHHTRALEDLPPAARAQAAGLVSAIPSPTIPSPANPTPAVSAPGLRDRIFDDLEDTAAGLYGNLERVRLLRFLSDYPVPSYTYRISEVMARGERPGPQKHNYFSVHRSCPGGPVHRGLVDARHTRVVPPGQLG